MPRITSPGCNDDSNSCPIVVIHDEDDDEDDDDDNGDNADDKDEDDGEDDDEDVYMYHVV